MRLDQVAQQSFAVQRVEILPSLGGPEVFRYGTKTGVDGGEVSIVSLDELDVVPDSLVEADSDEGDVVFARLVGFTLTSVFHI